MRHTYGDPSQDPNMDLEAFPQDGEARRPSEGWRAWRARLCRMALEADGADGGPHRQDDPRGRGQDDQGQDPHP